MLVVLHMLHINMQQQEWVTKWVIFCTHKQKNSLMAVNSDFEYISVVIYLYIVKWESSDEIRFHII